MNLSKYYHEGLHLINELENAFSNIEDSDNIDEIKMIANKAMNLIFERRNKYSPSLGKELHIGHLYSEYLSLPLKHEQVFFISDAKRKLLLEKALGYVCSGT